VELGVHLPKLQIVLAGHPLFESLLAGAIVEGCNFMEIFPSKFTDSCCISVLCKIFFSLHITESLASMRLWMLSSC
jgi:Na+/glutamate symporter